MAKPQLRVGLQLAEVEYVASWAQYLEMARIAEDAGFDSLWMGDHLLYKTSGQPTTGPWECLTVLTALATVTSRVELGPLVLSTSFRNPAMTAKIAETIDEISDGRFVLGLGAGWNQSEYEAFGFAYDHRFARFAEAFDIIHSLVRTGEVDYSGTFYDARECEIIPRGPRAGAMPILIGSTGERMLRHTLARVDRWNIWYADYGNSPDGLAPHIDRVDRICRELGRDPGTLERSAAVLVTAPGGSSRSTGAHHERFVPGITGSPEDVGRQLAAFTSAGIDHLQVVLDPITPAAIEWLKPALDHARTFGAEES